MSTFDINLLSAGGDGLKRRVEKTPLKRTPIPSSRKLTARPQGKNENVKRKLEEALHQLSSPKPGQFNRKRAQTMAEITPSKRKSSREFKLAETESETKSAPRKEDASRRVYQQLLLNAWRRRRAQVATLTDSSRRLQSQVDQLQIQINVLQKLRESESQKRLESANESERLKHEQSGLEDLVTRLRNEGKCMEIKISNLEQRLEEINAQTVNIKNELLTAKGKLSRCEVKLQTVHHDNEMLENEKQDLLARIDEYKKASAEQLDTIQRLERDLENVEENLGAVNLDRSNLEESKSELELKLENELDIRDSLEQQLIKARIREEKWEQRVHELKRSVCLVNETRRQMMRDNVALKRTLEELEMALKDERNKTWWKNIAKTMLNTLHNAAYVMLPAYPKKIDTFLPMKSANKETKERRH